MNFKAYWDANRCKAFRSDLVQGQSAVSGNICLSSSFCVLRLEAGLLKDIFTSSNNEVYYFVLIFELAGVLQRNSSL